MGTAYSRNTPQWQPNKKQTAAMMVEARNRGWSNSDVGDRFKAMGLNLDQMAGYSLPQQNMSNVIPQGRSQEQLNNILKNQQKDQGRSTTDSMLGGAGLNPFEKIWGPSGYNSMRATDPTKDKSWWDKIGNMLGKEGPLGGAKGWLDLGVQGLNAWSGYQQVGNARDQNKLARESMLFQQNAYNQDYGARKIAYNENANMRNDWKAAQKGGPGNYTMDTLIA